MSAKNDLSIIGSRTEISSPNQATPPKLRVVASRFSQTHSVKERKRRKSQSPIRVLRIERGFTLDELAKISGLSPSYLSRLEGGSRRLNEDILSVLCSALNCKPADLLQATPQEKSTKKEVSQSPRKRGRPELRCYCIADLAATGIFTMALDEGVETIAPPKHLLNQEKAFAIRFPQESLKSVTALHHIFYVDPSSEISLKSICFVTDTSGKSFVGRFSEVEKDQSKYVFEVLNSQNNAKKSISRGEIKSLFKVVKAA